MLDSEYSMDIYKSVEISLGANEKSWNVRIFSDHLKTKKLYKHAVKKLIFLISYVLDQYKTQQMCDKAVLENSETLKSVPDCYKDQQLNGKAVDNYPHALELGPKLYKNWKICGKASDIYPFTIKFVPEFYKTHKHVIKQFTDVFVYLILFLINIKLKKYLTLLLLYILF